MTALMIMTKVVRLGTYIFTGVLHLGPRRTLCKCEQLLCCLSHAPLHHIRLKGLVLYAVFLQRLHTRVAFFIVYAVLRTPVGWRKLFFVRFPGGYEDCSLIDNVVYNFKVMIVPAQFRAI